VRLDYAFDRRILLAAIVTKAEKGPLSAEASAKLQAAI
jgi:hypothetical protein